MAWSPTQVLPERCSVPPQRADRSRALPGGTANRGRVIRVGDAVLRPAAPCRPATHALLGHLAAVGFDGAPRVLAAGPYDETLTYIDGQAAVPPLAGEMLTAMLGVGWVFWVPELPPKSDAQDETQSVTDSTSTV